MRQKPKSKETKTDISSSEPIQGLPPAILANPQEIEESYETAWSRMLAEKDRQKTPPLDHLGRTPAECRKYQPAVDDLKDTDDQGDGKDAYGNSVDSDRDYLLWCEEIGMKALENGMSAKTGSLNEGGRMLVFRDNQIEFPELHLRVAVIGPPEDTKGFPFLFSRAYCEGATDVEEADLVVFTGGPDVNPMYYGEKPHPSFYGNEERDYSDIAVYMTCLEEGIPMMGVCRGAQFLAVMNGYKLVQDLDNHQRDHTMWDKRNQVMVNRVSSLHHQSVIPGEGMEVLGTSHESTYKWLNDKTVLDKKIMSASKYPLDIEAFFIRETCCLGFQGHPEYKGYHEYAKWCLEMINEFVILNEDVDWKNDRRRLRPEILKEQKLVRDNNRQILTVNQSAKEG